jgi:hypothetical protein
MRQNLDLWKNYNQLIGDIYSSIRFRSNYISILNEFRILILESIKGKGRIYSIRLLGQVGFKLSDCIIFIITEKFIFP